MLDFFVPIAENLFSIWSLFSFGSFSNHLSIITCATAFFQLQAWILNPDSMVYTFYLAF